MIIVSQESIIINGLSPMEHIERIGRICYKSEDKITDDSCYKFVDMLKSHAHGAMLEHGTIYLTVGPFFTLNMFEMCNYFETNPYSKYKQVVRNNARVDLITTNYRVICEAPQYRGQADKRSA